MTDLPHSVNASIVYKSICIPGIVLLASLFAGCADDNIPDGKDLYNDLCAGCHGVNNQGTAFAPPVVDATEVGIIQAITEIPEMDTPLLQTVTTEEAVAIAQHIGTLSGLP